MKLGIVLFAAGIAFAAAQDANVKTIEYTQGTTALEGKLVYPSTGIPTKWTLPSVVLMPDWMGVTPQAVAYAKHVADWGYVVFVADFYGKNMAPQNMQDAGKQSGALKKDAALLRERSIAAFSELKLQKGVDTNRIATMGFCFGAAASLELARSGAPLKGTVTIHGTLTTPAPEDSKDIHGMVLVLQGAEDPYATPAQAQAFADEMRKVGVDWQMVYYGGAVHAFTNPGAGTDPKQGLAYNAKADRRAFAVMKDFFQEAF